MRVVSAVFIVICISACVSTTTGTGFKTQLAQWNKLHTQPGFDDYVTTFVRVQNFGHVDINSGCYEQDVGTTVDLILLVQASGRISAAYTDNGSHKAKCFRKAYIGIKMPIPPFSPFPVRMKMR